MVWKSFVTLAWQRRRFWNFFVLKLLKFMVHHHSHKFPLASWNLNNQSYSIMLHYLFKINLILCMTTNDNTSNRREYQLISVTSKLHEQFSINIFQIPTWSSTFSASLIQLQSKGNVIKTWKAQQISLSAKWIHNFFALSYCCFHFTLRLRYKKKTNPIENGKTC